LRRGETVGRLANGRDAAVDDEHILLRVELVFRVDQATVLDLDVHASIPNITRGTAGTPRPFRTTL